MTSSRRPLPPPSTSPSAPSRPALASSPSWRGRPATRWPRGFPGAGGGGAEKDRRDRGDAFSAQSEVLLRNADILIAVDDPFDAGKTGGTREAIRKALEVGLPVVLMHLGEPGLAVLRTRADFDDP